MGCPHIHVAPLCPGHLTASSAVPTPQRLGCAWQLVPPRSEDPESDSIVASWVEGPGSDSPGASWVENPGRDSPGASWVEGSGLTALEHHGWEIQPVNHSGLWFLPFLSPLLTPQQLLSITPQPSLASETLFLGLFLKTQTLFS